MHRSVNMQHKRRPQRQASCQRLIEKHLGTATAQIRDLLEGVGWTATISKKRKGAGHSGLAVHSRARFYR